MSKIIVAGGRDFNRPELLEDTLDRLFGADQVEGICEIVCGEAKGADALGRDLAESYGIPVASFPAAWKDQGRNAGYIRNTAMAEYADVLVAFWDGSSKGTKHMIDIALAKRIEVHVVFYGEK